MPKGPIPSPDSRNNPLAFTVSDDVLRRVKEYKTAMGCKTISTAIMQLVVLGLQVVQKGSENASM